MQYTTGTHFYFSWMPECILRQSGNQGAFAGVDTGNYFDPFHAISAAHILNA
jgi:hypothetical protein